MTEEASFRWQSASRTEVGNVRKLNEDACLDLPGRALWVVADGMGGHQAGDVASQMVVSSLQGISSHDKFSAFVDAVEDQVLETNRRLHAMSLQGEEQQIIGCTLAAMLVHGAHCLSMWAGDSRVYRLRAGEFKQITRDHSELEEMIDRGQIEPDDAESHELGNVITRAVGGERDLYLDYTVGGLEADDRYLICSDGLYKELSAAEMQVELARGTCVDACRALIEVALSRTCSDNVTVIVVDFTEAAH